MNPSLDKQINTLIDLIDHKLFELGDGEHSRVIYDLRQLITQQREEAVREFGKFYENRTGYKLNLTIPEFLKELLK